ncbi:tetratricopeptide repeat protein [Chloroflexus sp.]|uniref:tetratricopeptide repeat protein n=1 Tax=Chloroflexus sp. TaxID=1904827 RepID=UPI002ACE9437|nr:tetratricopeptide repeat protein [Chloroflexus sp.]
MASQPLNANRVPAHRLATHRFGRLLLQMPELALLLPSVMWLSIIDWSPIAIGLGAASGLWFLTRYLLLWRARWYVRHGRYHEAANLALAACHLNPYSADAYWLLGVSAMQRNRPQLAAKYFRCACRLNPVNPKLHAALATALVLAEDPQEAIRYAHYARFLQQNTFEAAMVLSDCATMDQQIEHYLRTALPYARRPADRAVIYCALADHLLKTGRRVEAVSYLAQAIWLAPACPPATRGSLHYHLGELLWQCGETEMAREQFRASLKIDPRGPCAAHAWRAAALGLALPADAPDREQLKKTAEVINFVEECERNSKPVERPAKRQG